MSATVNRRRNRVGWARHSRHLSEQKQVEMLEAAGFRPVLRESAHDLHDLLRGLRQVVGDEIGVTSLARLASTRDLLREALTQIREHRAVVVELSTGRRIDPSDDAVFATLDACDEQTKDARALTRQQARKNGANGLETQRELREKRRMPRDEARPIWKNYADHTNKQCLALMPGWTERRAYRLLGDRGLAKGRPRGPKKHKT